ncbi:MAG: hypothetical protein L6R40_003906 [Gallowayella cf. fulva]|nr:MAG: hypothetical protein L6R40_003906 [Xanthomendoza cf. fulva]
MSQPWDYIAKLVCIGDSGTGKSSLTIRLCEGRFVQHHDVTIGVEFGSRIVPVGPPITPATNHQRSPSSRQQQPQRNSQHQGHADGNDDEQPQRRRMKLSLWDTAGQETYKSITRSYFRGASGALLVFDLTRRSTFEHATEWLTDLRQIAEEGIVVVLVGNKCDLAPSSTVSSSAATTNANGSAHDTKGLDKENKRAVTKPEAEEWCERNGVLRYVETSAKSGEGVEGAFLQVAERIYENVEKGRYDLNDRRSGVKGPGAGGGGPGAGGRGGTVRLGMNDVVGQGGNRGWGSGCC